MGEGELLLESIELIKKAEAKVEKIGDLLRLKVPEEETEKFRGKIITYLDVKDVKKALEGDFRECSTASMLVPIFVDMARREREKGDEKRAEEMLLAASTAAIHAARVCLFPELKEISDKILHIEELSDEKVGELYEEIMKKLGVEEVGEEEVHD